MAITIHTQRTLATGSNSLILSNQAQASVSMFLMIDPSTDCTQLNAPAMFNRPGFVLKVTPNGNDPHSATLALGANNASGTFVGITAPVSLQVGTVYHIAATWDASSSVILYVNKVVQGTRTTGGNIKTSSTQFSVGGPNAAGNVLFTLDQIAVWNGYLLSAGDVDALCNRATDITQIGTTATWRGLWTLSGTVGATVKSDDSGLANALGVTGDQTTLSSLSGSGTAVYAPALQYAPTAHINKAYVSTSGKSVFLFPTNMSTGAWTSITALNATPTVSINGVNMGPLTNPWNTGQHSCIKYDLPPGVVVGPNDVVTLDAPSLWALTPAGEVAPMTGLVTGNFKGRSCFGTESLPRTLSLGLNFPHLGTAYYTHYQLPKNWRYRLPRFGVTNTTDNYPLTLKNTTASGILYNDGQANGIDATGYPGPTGLFAVQWDDLNPSVPTTLALIAGNSSTVVTERTDLANPGDSSGRGKCRVFDVQLAPSATIVSTAISLSVTNANMTPQFGNLYIYGPDDFTATPNQPVTLDTSDPYALSNSFLKRVPATLGSCRLMDSMFSWGGLSGVTEPEQLRNLTDFSWGAAGGIEQNTFGFTEIRPFAPDSSTYIYSSFFGQPYDVKLNANVGSTDTTISVSAIDSPLLRGLYLTADSEKMRILAVSGTSITVERGSLGTTPAPHNAGTIRCTGRFPVPSLSALGNGWCVMELVTSTPHNLITGSYVDTNGSYPQPTFTVNGVSTSLGSFINGGTYPAFVTGPNTILTWLTNVSSPTVTLNAAIPCDPTQHTASVPMPDIMGFPYEFIAKVTANFPGAALHVNVPMGCSDALADEAARRIMHNFPKGREVWLELSNETWNYAAPIGTQWRFFNALSQLLGLGNSNIASLVWRSDQLRNRFRAIFDQQGRGSEVKLLINVQGVAANQSAAALTFAASRGIQIDGIAIGPYIDPDKSPASMLAYHQSDIEQILDLWVHDLYFKQSGWPNYLSGHRANIDSYNASTGFNCCLYAYEGGFQTAVPGGSTKLAAAITDTTSTTVRVADAVTPGLCAGMYLEVDAEWLYVQAVNGNTLTVTRGAEGTTPATHANGAAISNAIVPQLNRDAVYHPNWYIIEQDFYAMMQNYGLKHFNVYAYSMVYSGNSAWGIYHTLDQTYGRGDGSDGKADNRLCRATPGLPNSKSPLVNQDKMNVSVRGRAFIDWNGGSNALPVVPPPGPPASWRRLGKPYCLPAPFSYAALGSFRSYR
jgi:hypothetical protein